jgi:integrase/recombinase XerD
MNKLNFTAQIQIKAHTWENQLERLEGAYSAGTIRAYRSDIRTYAVWCINQNRKPFPASPKLLAKFIEQESQRCSASTIRRRLAAIGKLHRLLRLEDPVPNEEVKLAMRRVLRQKLIRPKQALGLTAKIRDQLIDACSENSLSGKRNRALIAVGYDSLARRSELATILLQNITFTEGGAKLLISRSKNDQYGNGRTTYLSIKTVKLLKDWINSSGISDGPVFRMVRNHTIGIQSLHPHSINRIIKTAAQKAGLSKKEVQDLSGHSMRIGAAQDMMVAGFDILPIMAAGGWKTTNVVARYIENADLSFLLSRFRQ